MNRHALSLLSLTASLVLGACGGGSDTTPAPAPVAGVAAPTITTGPTASTTTAGNRVTLSVVAAGGGTLSYQWMQDGTDIQGATASSYTTPVLSTADSGKSYTVRVSNSAGSATSGAAVISVTAAAGTAIALSQSAASQLVADVNAGVADLRSADAAGGLPFGAQTALLPSGATVTNTIDCATLGGSNGSGRVNFTVTVDDNTGRPLTTSFTYDNCTFGNTDYSYSINGTGSMVYSNWVSASDYSFTLTYDMSYSYTAAGYTDSGTVNSVETCRINGGLEDCSLRLGNNDIRNVSLQSNGSVTTVQSARITNSEVDCVYNGWTFDASTGRAVAGTVTVTAPNGDNAVITATQSGYTVVITVGGTTSTYTVPFGI